MMVYVSDSYYTAIQCSGNYTTTGNTLYPEFWVKEDLDQNHVADDWELPLAEKFCPYLILEAADQGVRPVPVEILDRNGDGKLTWQDTYVGVNPVGDSHIYYVKPDKIWIWKGTEWWNYKQAYPKCRLDEQWVYADLGDHYFQGEAYLIPHFEWGELGNTDKNHWYNSWTSVMNQHTGESSYQDGTTYAHLFAYQGHCIIQYWFFYPFNHWASRHEGDWEHINVVLSSQNPATAVITHVEYYFHKYVKYCYIEGSDYWVVGNTHPKVYVGGYGCSIDGYDGYGSHGSYPKAKKWSGVAGKWPAKLDENVHGNGLHINFNNYQNIVILPSIESVDTDNSPLNWMWFASHWGHPQSKPSAGEHVDLLAFTIEFISFIPPTAPYTMALMPFSVGVEIVKDKLIDDTSLAPRGPVAQDNLWEHIYSNCGWNEYKKN